MIDVELLTAEEVANRLRIALPTVYRLTSVGELPCIRAGASIRFRVKDIEEILDPHSEWNRGNKKSKSAKSSV